MPTVCLWYLFEHSRKISHGLLLRTWFRFQNCRRWDGAKIILGKTLIEALILLRDGLERYNSTVNVIWIATTTERMGLGFARVVQTANNMINFNSSFKLGWFSQPSFNTEIVCLFIRAHLQDTNVVYNFRDAGPPALPVELSSPQGSSSQGSNRRCEFKSRSSQHFSVDSGSVRLSWKISVHVNLWGWFRNRIVTLNILSWMNVKLSREYLARLRWLKTRLQSFYTIVHPGVCNVVSKA